MKPETALRIIGKFFDAIGIIGSIVIVVPRIVTDNPPLNSFEIAVLMSVALGLTFSIISDTLR